MIFSGSSAPSSTTCCVCTMVSCAARRHDRIEIPAGRPIGQIAPAVRFPGLDQRHVAAERFLEQIFAAGDLALLLAGGELGADGGRGEKGRECRRRRRGCAPPSCPAARFQARSCRRDKAPRTPPDRRCADTSRRSCARGRDREAAPSRCGRRRHCWRRRSNPSRPARSDRRAKRAGWPILPKPPSRTTAPSRMPAIASAMDCTILLIIEVQSSVIPRCERSEPIKSAVADLMMNNAKSGKPDFVGMPARTFQPLLFP